LSKPRSPELGAQSITIGVIETGITALVLPAKARSPGGAGQRSSSDDRVLPRPNMRVKLAWPVE